MKVKRFDLYEELWTKSRTAYCTEHGIEFDDLKRAIAEHNIPMPTAKYMYQYKKGNIIPKEPIQGEDYEIILSGRKSEKDKLFERWSYFTEAEKEKVYEIYSALQVPKRVGRYHRLVTAHREYEKEERRLEKEAERHPYGFRRSQNKSRQKVLNTWHISKETLPKYYLLCDTLFKALEAAGCTITLSDNKILVNIKSKQQVKNLWDDEETMTKVYSNEFTILLHFRDKNKRIKNVKKDYPPYIDEPTGYFKCEVIGRYPWAKNDYGIEKNFQGNYEIEELIKLIFARIFELPQDLYEAKVQYDTEMAERKRKEEEIERTKKKRENEFSSIKELIYEYKLEKELRGLSEFIKRQKVPKATMEEMLWYKATLKWLSDENRIDNGLSIYQHQDLINYLLDEKSTKDTSFNDNNYRW